MAILECCPYCGSELELFCGYQTCHDCRRMPDRPDSWELIERAEFSRKPTEERRP
jgi:hypothetical protein